MNNQASYQAPNVEVVGSLHQLTQMPTKFVKPTTDGYYLGVENDPSAGTVPLGS